MTPQQQRRWKEITADLTSQLATERDLRERYERMMAKVFWIEFETDGGEFRRYVSQPCGQDGKCWHDPDEKLFNTALEAFEALENNNGSKNS